MNSPQRQKKDNKKPHTKITKDSKIAKVKLGKRDLFF
jgi:hypothetical protein